MGLFDSLSPKKERLARYASIWLYSFYWIRSIMRAIHVFIVHCCGQPSYSSSSNWPPYTLHTHGKVNRSRSQSGGRESCYPIVNRNVYRLIHCWGGPYREPYWQLPSHRWQAKRGLTKHTYNSIDGWLVFSPYRIVIYQVFKLIEY